MYLITATAARSAHEVRRAARPQRCPVIGAVALDAMAAIAGPTWTPGYQRAWSAAFETVTTAMLAEAAGNELAVAA